MPPIDVAPPRQQTLERECAVAPPGLRHGIEQARKVLGHVVDPRQEHLARIRARIEQEIPGASRSGILAIELTAQHPIEQWRQRAAFHRQPEHLDDSLEIADPKIAQVSARSW